MPLDFNKDVCAYTKEKTKAILYDMNFSPRDLLTIIVDYAAVYREDHNKPYTSIYDSGNISARNFEDALARSKNQFVYTEFSSMSIIIFDILVKLEVECKETNKKLKILVNAKSNDYHDYPSVHKDNREKYREPWMEFETERIISNEIEARFISKYIDITFINTSRDIPNLKEYDICVSQRYLNQFTRPLDGYEGRIYVFIIIDAVDRQITQRHVIVDDKAYCINKHNMLTLYRNDISQAHAWFIN